jgi:hypothetical protein
MMSTEPNQASVNQFIRDALVMKKGVDALLEHVEQTYGLFHDAAQGWHRLTELFESMISHEIARGLSRERALKSPLVHGKGTPENGVVLHQSTLGDRLSACAAGGQNEITLSNLCLISIYSFWEDRTREEIAKALGIEVASVQSDLFGDISKFRNIILHAGGIMDERARSLRVLKWFSIGDKILINRDKLHEIIVLIRQFPEGLTTVGYDPHARAVNIFGTS